MPFLLIFSNLGIMQKDIVQNLIKMLQQENFINVLYPDSSKVS